MGKTNFTFVQRLLVVVTMLAFGFTQNAFAQPANDDCGDAATLAWGGSVNGTTTAATLDAAGTCGTTVTAPGVWYEFTVPGGGGVYSITLSTCDMAAYDTKLSVYANGCGALDCVAGIDDSNGQCGGFTSLLEDVVVMSGQTYLVLVHGFSSSTGNFTLAMEDIQGPFLTPANDECGDATVLAGAGVTAGTTNNSSADGVPFCDGQSQTSPGVWYTFTAGLDGTAVFSTCGSLDLGGLDGKLMAYSGGCGAFVCEAGNDDAFVDGCNIFDAEIQFDVTAGEQYWVLVSGFGSDVGDFVLSYNIPAPVVNGDDECKEATNPVVSNIEGTSATFSWTSTNLPINDHCWNFYIGNTGYDCDENEEFIGATVCFIAGQVSSNNPLVTVTGLNTATGVVTVDVEGLQPGTSYCFNILETCDGIPQDNDHDCDDWATGDDEDNACFNTFDDPYVVEVDTQMPTCPFGSAGPAGIDDGSFTITLTDSPTCDGLFDIVVNNPTADLNPTEYLGVTAEDGPFVFDGAQGGYTYDVTINEISDCAPSNDPVNLDILVPDGVDMIAPEWVITDILGNIIASTADGVGFPNGVTDLGVYELPEGSCQYQQVYFARGIDNCDGMITDPNALVASPDADDLYYWVFTAGGPLPGNNVQPNTQVVVTSDGEGIYAIDVNWAAGQTGFALNMSDAVGNGAATNVFPGGDSSGQFNDALWLLNFMDEYNDPEVVIVGINNVTVPACAESRTVTVTVYVDDLCDQLIDYNNLVVTFKGAQLTPTFTFPEPGNFDNFTGGYAEFEVEVFPGDDGEIFTAVYTDPWLNTGVADVAISVEQAAQDEPALIFAADENLTIPYCEDEVFMCYSFQIYDDCAPVDIAAVIAAFNDGGSGLTLGYVDDSNPNFVFFEACGFVSAGDYFPSISYDGDIVVPWIQVNQQQNQAPDITLPGNLNFTIPACADDLLTTVGIYIQDDCDDSTNDFTIDIFQGPPGFISWEWVDNGYIELTLLLTPGQSLLQMQVTDSDGASTYTDALFTVTDQPDNFDPIIVYPSQDFDIELDPCDAPVAADIDFYVTAADNCGVASLDVTLFAFGSVAIPLSDPDGDNKYELNDVLPGGAPVGQHYVQMVATDVNGNVTTETFEIDITQDPSVPDNLACIADLNITLDDECFAVLSPEIVLTGEWGCLTPDDFTVTVIDSNPLNGALIDGCGTFNYSIELTGADGNFTICWGEVTSEDKTSPVVECPADTYYSYTNGELICTDIDQILIDGVEYYTTDGDGNVMPGSMSSNLSYILSQTGRPYVWDNCDYVRVSVWDTVEESECGYDVITRHFKVADRYNSDCTGQPMTDECTQRIYVRKANIGDVNVPADIVHISCDENVALDADGFPAPSVTGFPTVSTAYGTYNLDDSYCNLGATYENSPAIDICANSYKVIRTWSIIDWCVTPATVTTYTQIIKVGDFDGPSISCNLVDTDWDGVGDSAPTYSTGPFDCTAAFPIPTPIVTDNCNDFVWYVTVLGSVEQDVYNQWGQVIGTEVVKVPVASFGPLSSSTAGPYISGIPMTLVDDEGNGIPHYFQYTAVDACGNTTSELCPFFVVDNIAPVAVCDDDLHISIGGAGYARVYAEDVDEGSNDNCELVSIEVRRAGGVWGPYVDFDCDDVHNYVTIELRVWDASGNSNICWLEVLIEDKINPYCHAPHNTALHCDDDELHHIDWDDAAQLNEVFGSAWAEDNCNATADQISVNNNLNDCGWGTVVRTFQATDDWGLTSTNACQQVITVYEVHNYEIKFPKDADAECGTPNPDTITYVDYGCDLLTVNVHDELYEATSDECYKILRTYKVINWCEWDGEAAPIVIGRDEDCDNNPGDENVYVIVRTTWNGPNPIYTTYVDRDNNENNTNPFTGTSRCTNLPKPNGHWANSNINTELASVGHWQYTQVIKVYDFVAPTAVVTDYDAFCSETADCFGDVTIEFTVTELCDLDVVTAEGFLDAFADGVIDGPATVTETGRDEAAQTITYEISGNYPIGAHAFGVHIEDGCENVLWLEIPFEVVDCKAPTPICINGLTVTLMPQPDGCCAMAIWASDFIASDVDDCTEPVKYSIHRADDVADGSEIPSPDVTGLVLDCNDDETTLIRIYSWDSAYNPYAVQPDGTIGGPNYDYCETYVLVQAWVTCDNGPAGATVAGAITTEDAEGLEGAEVQLAGGEFLDALTATDGSYEFTDVALGTDITITPHLDANPLNGVSTFDLVLISKHILGVQTLDSPYKMIAADVNSSTTITTADMIQLRKLILGVYTDFPNNTSWRFVDASYVFPDASNPWAEDFPEVINIDGLAGDELNENFISTKIGDVNGSATPNVTSVEERNVNGLFAIATDDVTVKSGNQYSVSFTAADLAKIQGYQFTLTFDKSALSLTDIEYGVATEENFGMTYLNEGIITTSWNGEAADNSVLFTLVFTANTEAQLSDLIGVSSRITVAEAYDNNGTLDVAINFNNGEVATAGFEVYQNTPNPFRSETIIGYNLPEDADVQITIQDVTGKTLQVINQTSAKGYNAYTLSAENLGTGVLYYTVSTDEFTATKKMILVKDY